MRDEQRETDNFVALCGGTQKADRLMRIWNNSYPGISASIWDKPSKEDMFRRSAARDGFTSRQVNAFLRLS